MAPDTTANTRNFNLFRRCVQCPPESPACPPTCPTGEGCRLISYSCDACAHTICAKDVLPGQLNESNSSSSKAPIAGGVVGAIAGLVIIGLLVWWFWLRPKRKAAQSWQNEKRSTMRSAHQQSVHSRRSVASTVLSRASNVIQIAYIPGVTVRSPPQSPGLVPPVPSLPGSSPNANNEPEQHFFMPSDLRASTWSDASSVNNRISLSPSLARTTYYGNEAEDVPPVPAQHAFRAQAAMVSVKSANNTPALSGKSPAVQQGSKMGNSSIVAKTMTARPIEIKKQGSNPRVPTLGNLAKENSKSTSVSASEKSVPVFFDEKEIVSPVVSEKEVVSPDDPFSIKPKPSFATMNSQRSSSVSGISRILPIDGPLASGNTHRHSKSEGLNAMIEQALRDAAGSTMKRPELKKQDSSPFSDVHEIDGKESTP